MLSLLQLGLRLTVAGRSAVLRSLSTAVGAGIATVTLLGVLAIAGSQVLSVTTGEQAARLRLFASLVAVVALPVIVLLAVVARLSATIRDRRLATLRLLGLSPRQAGTVAAVEAAVMSSIGTIVGAAVFVVGREAMSSLPVTGLDVLSTGSSLSPGVWIGVLLAVPLVTVLVTVAAMRRLSVGPLAVAHRGESARPSILRLAPLSIGVGLLGWSLTWPQGATYGSRNLEFAVSVGGILLTLVGLIGTIPLLVRGGADLLAAVTSRPSTLVAARRLQLEPATTTRLVAGLLVGLFVVSGAQCIVVGFEHLPGYEENRRSIYADPQLIRLGAPGNAPGAEAFEAEVARRELGTAYPLHLLETAPGQRRLTAVAGSCTMLRHALPGLVSCPNQPAWLNRPAGVLKQPLALAPVGGRYDVGSTLSLRAPNVELAWNRSRRTELQADLFVPLGYQNLDSIVASDAIAAWIVVTEPGVPSLVGVMELYERLFPEIDSMWRREQVLMVNSVRTIIWTVAAVVALIGLAAFLIAAIDRAVERRREDAALQVMGVSQAFVRVAQLQQVLIPLVIGIPAATALGLLSGASYLSFASDLSATPWSAVTMFGLAATAVALGAGVLTSFSVARPLSPELLRRE